MCRWAGLVCSRSGRLFVSTGDFEVAVKGTVFSVRHGMKGSRVAVLEGEVWVEKAGENTVLNAGQQFASEPELVTSSLEEEFAWSQKAESYVALLSELSQLHRTIQQATLSDDLRYDSRLVQIPAPGVTTYIQPHNQRSSWY